MGQNVDALTECPPLSAKPVNRRLLRRSIRFVAAALVGFLAWPAMAEAQLPPAEIVVMTGESPPDVTTGATFETISGRMDTRGRVLIDGTLGGSGITTDNDQGLWVGGPGGVIATVVREGDPAPDLPGLTLAGFPSAKYPSPVVGYMSFLDGPGVTIYNNLASFGGAALVTRVGEEAPGLGAEVTWSAGIQAANSSGQFLIFGTLNGTGIDSTNNEGLWRWDQGVFTPIVRLSDSADGGGTFVSLRATLGDRGFNDLSMVAFQGTAETSPGVYHRGVWVGPPGGLQLVVKEGDTVPTSTGTATVDILQSDPVLDLSGSSVAFSAQVDGSRAGLWFSNGTSVGRLVALQNEQIDGETYQSFSWPAISGGSVAFRASFYSSGIEGIVLDRVGIRTLVAHAGDPAPGAPAGAVFDTFSSPAINSMGQVVFKASMSGPPISAENQNGIWIRRSDGVLQPVALEGVPLPIASSAPREVDLLGFEGGGSTSAGQGNGIVLSNGGHILFTAIFADGTTALMLSSPEDFQIFGSGFEAGNTLDWSSTVP